MKQPTVNIFIKTDSHYQVDRAKVRKAVSSVLLEKRVRAKAIVSINIVGNRQMKKLNEKYRKIDKTTDVLSFPLSDPSAPDTFVYPPHEELYLGDIVVCYPVAVEDAGEEDKMVDDKIDELIKHGMLHLLGYHHD